MTRTAGVVVALVLLMTACDGYVEQVTLQADGSVAFAARATVVCADELAIAVWNGSPCDAVDAAVRGEEVEDLPYGYMLDQNRVALVADGERDRRRIDASWEGAIDGLSTVLVDGGSVRTLDENRTEATFTVADAPADRLSADADLRTLILDATWPAAEFRVVAPELVVEHNGDDIQGRTVIWNLDDDRPDPFRLVWSTEERSIRYWWWIVGAGILSAVLFMMLTLEGRGSPARSSGSGKD